MQGQANYARMAGQYEGSLNGIAMTLTFLAEDKYLTHQQLIERLKTMSQDIKERVKNATKELQ